MWLLLLLEEILFLLSSFLYPGAVGGFRVSFVKKIVYVDFLKRLDFICLLHNLENFEVNVQEAVVTTGGDPG